MAIAYLGVDVGTSGCKTVVIDRRGRVIQTAWASYATRRSLDGEVSQDARDWLAAVRDTIRRCVADMQPDTTISGLSVTAPAHVGVLVDREGEPLARCLLAFDARPKATAEALARSIGDALYEQTFVRLTASWTFPQLAWLRAVRPEVWPRIAVVLTQKDFIRFALTGTMAIDPTDAAGTAMYDPRLGRWLPEVLDELRLSADQMPALAAPANVAGGLTRRWARATGLRAGTPVAVGATDTAAELISVGATSAADSHIKVASTGTVVAVSDEPIGDPRLMTYPHAVPGRWYTLAATSTAATAYTWLRETVMASDAVPPESVYREMDRIAARAAPGADGVLFLPFLEGERTPHWDRDLRAAFVGLSSAHRRDHLCRAVLEGVAFSIRLCVETMESCGLQVDQPSLGGGGSASRLWRSILVSVIGRSARLLEPQGPAVGAAMLAAEAVGDATAARPRGSSRMVTPRADWSDIYRSAYQRYRLAEDAIAPLSHAIVSRPRTPTSQSDEA